ncbi:efflux RND transporter permease subunit [Azospirillum sp.]|uniref:efflux RND transporter permease subunit n=1 Tax=Azospirillum sp. TaxID=34012 RepID=UPI002D3CFD6B|nr:MMPL family transporter [Azospirillum sp.]HYD67327.1 MMPL family transporter [Azospirillum sp.]
MSKKHKPAGALRDVDLDHHKGVRSIEAVIERRLFGHRIPVLIVFAIVSVFLAWHAVQLRPTASFEKMVPARHPYVANYLAYESQLRPLNNLVRIAVENTKGDIYDPAFLETLKKITDEVFYIPGVDRGNLQSLWTSNVQWYEVTEDGLRSGTVIPATFDGSPEKVREVRTNVVRSNRIGSLVASDHRSAAVLAPLLEVDPQTGEKLDYGLFAQRLETLVRDKYQSDTVRIHITGFAKIVGDLIDGIVDIAAFFALTFVLTAVLLYWYSRCWRGTLSTLFCCSLAVVWQLGILDLLGLGLDPYSVLVPFLTFAIGVSHAVQNINTMAAERAQGRPVMDAAKATFRLLFIPGTIALVCDAVGFSTLMVIDIGVIQELAINASVGVAVIIVTKMFLLPIIMSYAGTAPRAVEHYRARMRPERQALARVLSRFAEPRWAAGGVACGLALLAVAYWQSRDLKIGDLDPGAPELRLDSRYNQDVQFFLRNYSTSPDVFAVIVKTPAGECGSYPVAAKVDQFQWRMENVGGVEATSSLFGPMKRAIAGTNGGDLRWYAVTRNRFISNAAHKRVPADFYNTDCSMLPVLLFLADHKAETLSRVVAAVESFAKENNGDGVEFLLAAGNAGIEAATNTVIKEAEAFMLVLVYGIVALLVLWEFKSWRVTVALMVPLFITSMLCEAIMARLGVGVKVATLPVVALGVGIGVDYGIYIYNRLEQYLEQGLRLREAYLETLKTTGSAVAVTGVTLALGVMTWTFSSIKFQADMGLLLTFMFLWNMVGAVVMIPALITLLMPELRRNAPAAHKRPVPVHQG